MGFKAGIVGLPNVGKSTIFNAITKAGIPSENYPFTTIEPNHGVVEVPDPRIELLIECVQPKSVVKSFIDFVDIAGLVKGASKGDGLGNQFLSNIRNVDAIIHIVRCFDDENTLHVEGSVDPVRDIEIINTELILSDYEILDNSYKKLLKQSKSNDPKLNKKKEAVKEVLDHVAQGFPVRDLCNDNPALMDSIKEYNLITAMPVLYVANVDEDSLHIQNDYVKSVQKIADAESSLLITLCGKVESEISELDEEDAKEFLLDLGLERSGLDALILKGYELLNLITFFTAGEVEVRAWTVSKGAFAQEAAGKIHSDIQRGFIRAEVSHYDDFKQLKSFVKIKEAGKLNIEGKEYIVQDGDIIYFRFNV